jgi:hypothetical protein
MKKFLENPVGWTVLAIIALVIITAYKDVLVIGASIAAGLIALVFIGRFALRRWGGGAHEGGNYCTHCPHPTHGQQACGSCRCAHS